VTLPDHVFSRLDGLNRRAGHDIRPHLDLTIEALPVRHAGHLQHRALLGILPTDGARPSELAEAMRISKQAVGQRLVEMEARGWITINPDPIDKRARIVTRTPAGDEIKAMSEQAIAAMERNWADQVGADRYRVFKEVLNELALG
jgi:DNA-binding MarR family transcriptional regulator